MPARLYTRTGDTGVTGLFGGQRVSKDDLRVEAYGTVDELNAVLGSTRALHPPVDMDILLHALQNELFLLGGDLATPDAASENRGRISISRVSADQVVSLEAQIDRYEEELPPLTQFILPGGCPLAASLHHARVVCRRAERRVVTLAGAERETQTPLNLEIVRYLNRLSDLLFVLARVANARQGDGDVLWQSPEPSSSPK